jgi:general stress protein 26
MLTTRSPHGDLHSRAMTPCAPHESDPGHGLYFLFFANNVSHKFDEIKTDHHVNVSFYNYTTTDWASVAGKARITQDKKLIKDHWSPQ